MSDFVHAGSDPSGLDEPIASLFPVVVATRLLVRAGVFGLAIGGLASAAYQILGETRDRQRYPPPGELVDIGGRRLHQWRAGEGGPVVVVAPSLAEPGHGWAEIQRRLAQHTTVVLYDRAGLGWSDPGPWPTGKRMVEDLHALLGAAGIPPPYVLVGHSAGGLLTRLYTVRYPEQVAGLVLVDPATRICGTGSPNAAAGASPGRAGGFALPRSHSARSDWPGYERTFVPGVGTALTFRCTCAAVFRPNWPRPPRRFR